MTFDLTEAIGLILTAFVLLQQIAVWQRKEYRWDRLWADLPGIPRQVVTGRIRRPQFTVKVLVIFAVTAVLLGLVYVLFARYGAPPLARWLVIVLLTPLTTAVAVVLGNVMGDWQKKRRIEQARMLRQQFSNLRVIGITGSYGKTSTKYFLHHLLSGTGEATVMSAERRNEAYVVAEDMLAHLTPETRTYIVEMGAYRQGEIARTAAVVQPVIAVVTAISNQHMALFGSLAALAAAKWELVKSVPAGGTAVLNADDPIIKKQSSNYSGHSVWYSLQQPADVYASNIAYASASTRFTLHIKEETADVTIPLPGAGYAQAAVAAAAAAHAAGGSLEVIASRLTSLSPIPQTMAISKSFGGATIIDDSYSANEAGVLMAIRHLALFPQPKKVVVLRPLIELGEEAPRVHAAIGRALATSGAEVFLYDVPGAEDIEAAMKAAGTSKPVHRLAAPAQLVEALSRVLDKETVCLLENRLPDMVRQAALA
jgi:UDP-N-acetylmuramoyl-tripeptide--D-alanyl-D-alanine ligase